MEFISFNGLQIEISADEAAFWLHHLSGEAENFKEREPWLAPVAVAWRAVAHKSTGVIRTFFDEIITSSHRLTVVLGLLERALVRVRAMDTPIPVSAMNELKLLGGGVFYTKDIPTEIFISAGLAIDRLLRGIKGGEPPVEPYEAWPEFSVASEIRDKFDNDPDKYLMYWASVLDAA